MRYFLFNVLFVFLWQTCFAQELEVVEPLHSTIFEIVGAQDKKYDANGIPCAVVKVQLPVEGVAFEGNVIESQYHINEYWVWFSSGTNGTKKFRIKCPRAQMLEIDVTSKIPEGLQPDGKYAIKLNLSRVSSENQSTTTAFMISSHLGDSPYFSVKDSKKIPLQQAHNKCRTIILNDYASLTLEKASEYIKKKFGAKNELYFNQPLLSMGSMHFPMNSTKFIRDGNTYTITLEQLNERPVTLQIIFYPDSGEYSFVFTNIDGEKYDRIYSEIKLSTQNFLFADNTYSDKIYATTGNVHLSYPFLFDILDIWHQKFPK